MKTGNMAEKWIASGYKTKAATAHHPSGFKTDLGGKE
jgi:hypothetical protein